MEQGLSVVERFFEVFRDAIFDYAPDVASALIILFVGWGVSEIATRVTRRGLNSIPRMDNTLKPIFLKLIRYGILIVTLIAVLSEFGVETASVLTVLGAAGLAIGLALQGTLQNIAAGIMILLLRPFKVGDFIDAGGISGTVKEIMIFTTELTTADGVYLSVPNSSLWSTTITNFSRNKTRRIQHVIGISYQDDIAKARGILLGLMEKHGDVLKDPQPMTAVTVLNNSSVDIVMRCWVPTDDFWGTHFDLLEQSKIELEKAGISIPFPQTEITILKEK